MTTQLAQDAIIVSLQNGVENAEIISRVIGRRALPAVVYVAVELVAPGHVQHKARGDLIVGDPAGRDRPGNDVERVAALFESAQVPCRVSQNIQGELWFKLILNAAGNGVTALARASYGEVARHSLGREVMAAVVREAETVARAAGVELPAGDLVSQVLSFAEAMGDAHSSTLQDVLRGKRTEIGELNGYVAEMGKKYGVATQVNSTIHSLVRILEAGVIERLR
jgi:2-dehydropantoate 2-reductase